MYQAAAMATSTLESIQEQFRATVSMIVLHCLMDTWSK